MKTTSLIVCVALLLSCASFAPAQFGQPPAVHSMPTNSQNISTNVPPTNNSAMECCDSQTSGMSEYQYVLSNLGALQSVDSSSNTADDWFVVGGMVPRRDGSVQVKFNKFQGEQYVAQRVAEFVELNNNNCRYQIFGRASSEDMAEDMVDDLVQARVKHNSQVRQARIAVRQAEINRMRMQAGSQSGGYGGFGMYGGGGITGGGSCGSGGGGGGG